MKTIAKILIIILLFSQDTLAQSVNCDSLIEDSTVTIGLYPNTKTERSIQNELYKVQGYINLTTFLYLRFADHVEFQELVFKRKGEDIIKKDNVQIRHSTYVMLKSGLSWEISSGPPPKPKNFIFKLMNKKRRDEKPVKDRIDYLKFCGWYNHYGLNNCTLEGFEKVEEIIIDNKMTYRLSCILKYNADNKLIMIDKAIKRY